MDRGVPLTAGFYNDDPTGAFSHELVHRISQGISILGIGINHQIEKAGSGLVGTDIVLEYLR